MEWNPLIPRAPSYETEDASARCSAIRCSTCREKRGFTARRSASLLQPTTVAFSTVALSTSISPQATIHTGHLKFSTTTGRITSVLATCPAFRRRGNRYLFHPRVQSISLLITIAVVYTLCQLAIKLIVIRRAYSFGCSFTGLEQPDRWFYSIISSTQSISMLGLVHRASFTHFIVIA